MTPEQESQRGLGEYQPTAGPKQPRGLREHAIVAVDRSVVQHVENRDQVEHAVAKVIGQPVRIGLHQNGPRMFGPSQIECQARALEAHRSKAELLEQFQVAARSAADVQCEASPRHGIRGQTAKQRTDQAPAVHEPPVLVLGSCGLHVETVLHRVVFSFSSCSGRSGRSGRLRLFTARAATQRISGSSAPGNSRSRNWRRRGWPGSIASDSRQANRASGIRPVSR